MALTVRDALSIGGMQHALLVAGGKGLDRNVEHVTVVETGAVDVLRGGELVLSTFRALRGDLAAQLRVVRAMSEVGSSGLLLFYLQRHLGVIESAVLEEAERLSLPLFTVPDGVLYIDIITPILSTISNQRLQQLEFASGLSRGLWEGMLEGENQEDFTIRMVSLIGLPVAFLDQSLVQGTVGWLDPPLQRPYIVDHQLRWVQPSGEELSGEMTSKPWISGVVIIRERRWPVIAFPVRPRGKLLGAAVLVLREKQQDDRMLVAGHQAAIACGCHLLTQEAVRHARREGTQQCLEELLEGAFLSEDTIRGRLRDHGLDMPEKGHVLAVRVEGLAAEEDTVGLLTQAFRFTDYGRVAGARIKGTIALLAKPSQKLSNSGLISWYERVGRHLQEYFRNRQAQVRLTISIGYQYRRPFEVRSSWLSALSVVGIADRLHRAGSILVAAEMEDWVFLDQASRISTSSLSHTIELISRLISHDQRCGSELFRTLCASLEAYRDVDTAAKSLSVHRNTVTYRRGQIRAVLGLDPFDPANYFRFKLGCRLNMLKPPMPEQQRTT